MGLHRDSGGDRANGREHSDLREHTTHGCRAGADGDIRPDPGCGAGGQPACQRVRGQCGDGAAQRSSGAVDKLADRRFRDTQRRRQLGASQPLKRTTQQRMALPAR
jgi:hypothetical protein